MSLISSVKIKVILKRHDSLCVRRRIPLILGVRRDALQSLARFRQVADPGDLRSSPGLSPCKAVASQP